MTVVDATDPASHTLGRATGSIGTQLHLPGTAQGVPRKALPAARQYSGYPTTSHIAQYGQGTDRR